MHNAGLVLGSDISLSWSTRMHWRPEFYNWSQVVDSTLITNLPQHFIAMISAKLRHHDFLAVCHNTRIAGARGHVHSFAMNSYSDDVV